MTCVDRATTRPHPRAESYWHSEKLLWPRPQFVGGCHLSIPFIRPANIWVPAVRQVLSWVLWTQQCFCGSYSLWRKTVVFNIQCVRCSKGKGDTEWLVGVSTSAALCRVIEKDLSDLFEQRSEGSEWAHVKLGGKSILGTGKHKYKGPKTRVYFGTFHKQQRNQLSRMEWTRGG